MICSRREKCFSPNIADRRWGHIALWGVHIALWGPYSLLGPIWSSGARSGSISVQKVGLQTRSGAGQSKMWVFKPVQEQVTPKCGFSNPFRSRPVQNVGFQTRSGAGQSKMWVFKLFPAQFSPSTIDTKQYICIICCSPCLGTDQTILCSASRAADQLCANPTAAVRPLPWK
jgi:hypothetical protein